jgi:hypothetical protein
MADEVTTNGNGNGRVRWKNRRRMAWTSLISIIVMTFFILFTDAISVEKLKVLGEVITWFYFCMSSIIGFYMGATTFAYLKGK